MSHGCCIQLCDSKQGGKNNPRCLFRIQPESPNYTEVFNAVSHHLKPNKSAPKTLYVCDLHYEKSCILTSDLKIWKDGVEVTVPRQKRRLKDNSIPSIFTLTSSSLTTMRNRPRRTRVCAVKFCKKTNENLDCGLFKFPTDPERAKIWCQLCDCENLLRIVSTIHSSLYRVCEAHFDVKMFMSLPPKRRLLYKDSYPCQNLTISTERCAELILRWKELVGYPLVGYSLIDHQLSVKPQTDPEEMYEDFVQIKNDNDGANHSSEMETVEDAAMIELTNTTVQTIKEETDSSITTSALQNIIKKRQSTVPTKTSRHFNRTVKKTKLSKLLKITNTNTTGSIVLKATSKSELPITLVATQTKLNVTAITDFVNGENIWDGDWFEKLVYENKLKSALSTNANLSKLEGNNSNEVMVEINANDIKSEISDSTETLVSESKPNLSKNCRICMEVNENMTEIKELQENTEMYSLLIYFDIQIIEDDKAPHQICQTCKMQLESITSFRNLSLDSYKFMSEVLQLSTSDEDIIIPSETKPIEEVIIPKNEPQEIFSDENSIQGEVAILKSEPLPQSDQIPEPPPSDLNSTENVANDRRIPHVVEVDTDADSVLNEDIELGEISYMWDQSVLRKLVEKNYTIRLYRVHHRRGKQCRNRCLKTCLVCGKKVYFTRYKEHVMDHEDAIFPCNLCTGNFKRFLNYHSHLNRRVHKCTCSNCSEIIKYFPRNGKYVTCEACGTRSNSRNLPQPVEEKVTAPPRHRYCYQCMVPTFSESGKPKNCVKCGLSFNETNVFKCPECSNNLNESCRNGVCSDCGYRHQLKCECGQKYKTLFGLLFHQKRHGQEQPCVCHICGKN